MITYLGGGASRADELRHQLEGERLQHIMTTSYQSTCHTLYSRQHTEGGRSARRHSGSTACCGARRRRCRSTARPSYWPAARPRSTRRGSVCAHPERVAGGWAARLGARARAEAVQAATWLPPPRRQQPCPPPGRKTSPRAQKKTRGWPKPNRGEGSDRAGASRRAGEEALEARRRGRGQKRRGRRQRRRQQSGRGELARRRRCARRVGLWLLSAKSQ
jgi:hypothetical protein